MSQAGAGACEGVGSTVILQVDPDAAWPFMRRGVKHTGKFRLPPVFSGWALTHTVDGKTRNCLRKQKERFMGFVCRCAGKVVG